MKKEAEKLGLILFSTPFDHSAVDFLEEMGVPAYKIASFEIVDLPLLRKVARTGKPVILSTGMSTLEEIDEAVRTLSEAGAERIALLKCTSAYPALPEEMNLKEIARQAALAAEREAIARVLQQTRWNRKKTAKILSVSYKTLLTKIKETGLDEN